MSGGQFGGFDPELTIDKAHTLPYSWYIDRDVFEAEKRRIFETSWIAVGRTGEVADPGDYITGRIVDNPYVVVRGDDGVLRAFHNVCRHHAAEVAQESGSCRELVCPYHGWTYRLDGSLRRCPRIGKVPDFDPANFGLAPISVGTFI